MYWFSCAYISMTLATSVFNFYWFLQTIFIQKPRRFLRLLCQIFTQNILNAEWQMFRLVLHKSLVNFLFLSWSCKFCKNKSKTKVSLFPVVWMFQRTYWPQKLATSTSVDVVPIYLSSLLTFTLLTRRSLTLIVLHLILVLTTFGEILFLFLRFQISRWIIKFWIKQYNTFFVRSCFWIITLAFFKMKAIVDYGFIEKAAFSFHTGLTFFQK